MYTPYLQVADEDGATFQVRTAGGPLAAVTGIREATLQVDPNVPLIGVTAQIEEVEGRLRQENVFARAYTMFGLALLVTSVGLFGLMSYSVAPRTNEIGIRIALGAQRQDVVWLVIGESMFLVAAAVAIGFGGAIACQPSCLKPAVRPRAH